MLVEMRTYRLKPGSVAEYLKLYEEKCLRIHHEILGNLIGYLTTEIGDINQVVHRWDYESFEDRQQRHGKLAANEEWRSFLHAALPYFEKQENRLMNCVSFLPIR